MGKYAMYAVCTNTGRATPVRAKNKKEAKEKLLKAFDGLYPEDIEKVFLIKNW